MIKKLLAFMVGFVGIFALVSYLPYKNNLETELTIRNRVVRINTVYDDGVAGCTGTLLSHNFILTNAHCFPRHQEYKTYIRRVNDQEYLPAVVVSSATTTDYALLKFNGPDTSKQVDFTSKWHLGQEIILYGNPGIQDFVVGRSRIIGYSYIVTPMHDLRTMYIYPCNQSAPGFSGSGIYNMQGEYMGTHELGQEIPVFAQVLSRIAGEPRQGPLCFAIPAGEAIHRNLDRPWYGYNLEDDKPIEKKKNVPEEDRKLIVTIKYLTNFVFYAILNGGGK